MHVDPDRLLFMFDERILIFLKSDSFYLPSVKTPKMAANPLKKTEIRRYTTEVPAFRPFFQRYGWTLCILQNYIVTLYKGHKLTKGDNPEFKKKNMGQLFFDDESIYEISKPYYKICLDGQAQSNCPFNFSKVGGIKIGPRLNWKSENNK